MTFFPRSVPNGIVVESFFSRSEVAMAIERELADHVYSYISFVKCSPGSLDTESGLLAGLLRQARNGARLDGK
ncbi:MAG: hypothetical protein LC808_20960, partial [Actinobacteria bacterium]|nr:hypothetical protein [Actinomycetota bacterium]